VKALLVATAFLTRIPVRVDADGADVGHAARWFPLVGAGLGGVGALIARGLDHVTGVPPALGALLLVGLGVWVTGAIHLDGLADTADGFGGGRGRDEVLRIMRDPLIGSYGATALILVMSTKVGALATLLERHTAGAFIVAAPTVSRWTIVALSAWLPYARAEGGLGQAVTRECDMKGITFATAVTVVVAIALLRTDGLILWALASLVMIAVGRTAGRRIGGVTGDVFGASVELTETAVLVGAVLLTGPA
jgi:adenosylcobinamide-GDP ribazoletransferase